MKWLALGVLAGVLLGGGGAFLFIQQRHWPKTREALRAWEPVAVLTFSRNMKTGETVAAQDLVQVELPLQFVVGSFVRPEHKQTLVGQRLTMAVPDNAVVTWSVFASRLRPPEISNCSRALLPRLTEAAAKARAAALERFKAGYMEVPAAPPPAGAVAASVLVLTKDVAEGETLEASMLAAARMSAELRTESMVLPDDRDLVVGARASAPMIAGDPLLWQTLGSTDGTATVADCISVVSGDERGAKLQAAAKEAAAFIAGVPQ